MSTLQVANVHFENTGNNRIQYTGSNTYALVAGGNTAVTINSSSFSIFGSNISPFTGMKNRIINGAMVIDQRNAGANGTSLVYPVDRWSSSYTQAGKLTWGQNLNSVTPPAGFSKYLGVQTASAYPTLLASDYFGFSQSIEGFNVADLAWGTASAKTITVSFWIRSSLTGSFGVSIYNNAFNRSYLSSYTINSANTWEYKTVTIPGETSGTWPTNTGTGLLLYFSLGDGSTYTNSTANTWLNAGYDALTGSTSVVGTSGATWYITGVQLEVGTTATSFEYRPYGTELALCQRYYEVTYYDDGTWQGVGTWYQGTSYYANWQFKVEKRAKPTFALSTGSWPNGTPTVYAGKSNISFYSSAAYFYALGTSGNIALTASAEL